MKKAFNKKLLFLTIILAFMCVIFPFGTRQTAFANQDESLLDISGLSMAKAVEKTQDQIIRLKHSLKINVVFEDEIFVLTCAQLQEKNANNMVKQAREEARGDNFFERINIFKFRSKKIIIRNMDLFSGVDAFINKVAIKANREMQEPMPMFYPNQKTMFKANSGVVGVKVDTVEFRARLYDSFKIEQNPQEIALPVVLKKPTKTADEVVSNIKQRATFSTNYSSSVGGRRHNVLLSLSAFNGMVVKPDEIVSFNAAMRNIPTSRFKSAKIIVNGEFVDGIGGGMCQASSTLYNAVLLSGLETIKSYSHSLPVGYVKFGFDAMVNPGSADLVFKNNTDENIYIKTYGNNDDCFVEIYGEPMPKGLVIKRKSVNIGTLKHQGDKIIPDVKGIYANKALFKGEFHRVKYPREGYEAKSYLQYWVDGELVEEKYLRYSRYNAQQGIVYEGVEDLPEGMEHIVQTMQYPIKKEQTTAEELSPDEVEEKVKKTNPSHYNP